VKVALLRGKQLPEALARHGLDEIAWRREERRRTEALSRATERGDLAALHALRRAMHDAQRRSG
jgi:hypothetical protein